MKNKKHQPILRQRLQESQSEQKDAIKFIFEFKEKLGANAVDLDFFDSLINDAIAEMKRILDASKLPTFFYYPTESALRQREAGKPMLSLFHDSPTYTESKVEGRVNSTRIVSILFWNYEAIPQQTLDGIMEKIQIVIDRTKRMSRRMRVHGAFAVLDRGRSAMADYTMRIF